MARIPVEVVERLKTEVSVQRLDQGRTKWQADTLDGTRSAPFPLQRGADSDQCSDGTDFT